MGCLVASLQWHLLIAVITNFGSVSVNMKLLSPVPGTLSKYVKSYIRNDHITLADFASLMRCPTLAECIRRLVCDVAWNAKLPACTWEQGTPTIQNGKRNFHTVSVAHFKKTLNLFNVAVSAVRRVARLLIATSVNLEQKQRSVRMHCNLTKARQGPQPSQAYACKEAFLTTRNLQIEYIYIVMVTEKARLQKTTFKNHSRFFRTGCPVKYLGPHKESL